MKIVIDIPNELYNEYVNIQLHNGKSIVSNLLRAIQKGTPLPEHHGRLIDKDKMIADLLTVDPRYKKEIDWCVRITDAQLTIIEGSESE